MKSINKVILFIGFLIIATIVGCHKESDLFTKLSSEDEQAQEGMEKAFKSATLYNDSIIWCSDINQNCSDAFINYHDSLYHYNIEQYESHHDNYSHNNTDDDHHHSAKSEHHHSMNEHEEEEEHGHNQESHSNMSNLREYHRAYHPI